MKRFKIYDLRFRILAILVILFINHCSLLINQALASDATGSADIQTQLKTLEQEIASKAAKIKQQISNKTQNKVFIGTVQSLTNNSITISATGSAKMVSFNQDTDWESDNPKIKTTSVNSIKDIKPQQRIAALGDIDDTGVLNARRVTVLAPETTPKVIIWGQVSSITGNSSQIKDKDGKVWAVSLSKIDQNPKANDMVIVTGFMDKEGKTIDAEFVFVVPILGASPSPTSIATPSATPKGSIKPTPKASVKK